ncbi:glycosyltransferase family 32 protein [Enterovibrio norvegicus]|uniref:glycosyltransferase family 32 protein n=1 Tax=Enterovibrio norvegicus TaxID=188144 RepID=UPI00352F566C
MTKIPKIVHYCWFGGGELSPLNVACIETWEKLSGYKFILWNEENSPMDDIVVKHFYKKKQWAFVSDYVRLFALNKYGGVYLDTDIEVVSDIEPLLDNELFIAEEEQGKFNNCIFGSVPEHEVLSIGMDIMRGMVEKNKLLYSPEVITLAINQSEQEVTKLPKHTFFPYNPFDKESSSQLMFMDIRSDTYAIHHWAHSWGESVSFIERLGRLFSKLFGR